MRPMPEKRGVEFRIGLDVDARTAKEVKQRGITEMLGMVAPISR